MTDSFAQELAAALAADYEPFAQSYRAEHDVADIAAGITQHLHTEINRIRSQPAPSAGRRLQMLTGGNGFGKTHLMGRLLHKQQQQILLVYVPQAGSMRRPEELAQEYLVDELFRPKQGGISALQARLGEWYAPILQQAWERSAPQQPGRTEALEQLKGPQAIEQVGQILRRQTNLPPWLIGHLEVAVGSTSGTDADILRGLTLGLTPHASEAKQWLQGRPLPPDRARVLGLRDQPPEVQAVLQTVAELWRGQPLVMCFDQMEVVIAERRSHFAAFCNLLMGWLHTVPNTMFILAVVEETWDQYEFYQSFRDRIERHRLNPVTNEQAYQIIRRRLPPTVLDEPNLDLDSVRHFFANGLVSPRQVLRQCAEQFNLWHRSGRTGRLTFSPGAGTPMPAFPPAPKSVPPVAPVASSPPKPVKRQPISKPAQPTPIPLSDDERLRKIWQTKYDQLATRHSMLTNDETFGTVARAVSALVRIAQQRPEAGIIGVHEQVILNRFKYPLIWQITPSIGSGPQPVVIALAPTHEDSRTLRAWVDACGIELANCRKLIVLRPSVDLSATKKSNGYRGYQELIELKQRVTEVRLLEPRTTRSALETLAWWLDEAKAGKLQFNEQPLTPTAAVEQVVRLELLQPNPLLPILLDALTQSETPTPSAGAGPPAVPTPTPSNTKVKRQSLAVTVLEPLDTSADQLEVQHLQPVLTAFFDERYLPVEFDGFTSAPNYLQLRFRTHKPLQANEFLAWATDLRDTLNLVHQPLLRWRAERLHVELPRPTPKVVRLAKTLGQRPADYADRLACPVGVGLNQQPVWLDLSDPNSGHVLITGVAQSGKANLLRVLIAGLADGRELDSVQFSLLDPTGSAFTFAESPTIDRLASTPMDCLKALHAARRQVEQRLATPDPLAAKIIVVIDRYHALGLNADQQLAFDTDLAYLTEHGAAVGVHVLLSTLRTQQKHLGLKASFPVHLALHGPAVPGMNSFPLGADVDCLCPPGDLFWLQGDQPVRIQAPALSIAQLAEYLKTDVTTPK